MNIVEFLDAIGPVARVILVSGLAVVIVFGLNSLVEWIGWEDKNGIDIAGIKERIKTREQERARILARTTPAAPLARTFAHPESASQAHRDHFYPPRGRF